MPTRLLLEGNNLEALLARVRDEHGSDAQIVSAERVRTGGIGGFFARERFELTIEVSEADRPAPISPEPRPTGPARHAVPARHAAPEEQPGQPSPASLEDLAAIADTADSVASFAQVLASVRGGARRSDAEP
ncbi:MAG: hypothetical protein HKP61_14740, partial [Dactylosporangium sp.]|nr:hypothetical protein [Dactylosporangium sp.]NNJ62168.1 hypothetical protein [Dactylosporangium sp.]